MQIVTHLTSKKSSNGTPPPIKRLFCSLYFSKITLNVYKNIKCKLTHVRYWQLELHCVTALLTLLPYNSLKSYCANTKLNLFFNYGYADGIESILIHAAKSRYATKQSTPFILLFYMLLNFKYIHFQYSAIT